MPPLHYAMCGCEDLPGYPEDWQDRARHPTAPETTVDRYAIGVNTWIWVLAAHRRAAGRAGAADRAGGAST